MADVLSASHYTAAMLVVVLPSVVCSDVVVLAFWYAFCCLSDQSAVVELVFCLAVF